MRTLGDEKRLGPLNGWRAIAEYLGCNQSTAKRWAADHALPVHRPKGSEARKGVPVYAFAEELDGWLRNDRPQRADGAALPGFAAAPAKGRDPVPLRWWVGAALVMTIALLAIGGLAWRSHGGMVSAPATGPGHVQAQVRALYADGVYLMEKRTPASLPLAVERLTMVSQRAPDYDLAWAGLATAYNLMVEYRLIEEDEGYRRSKSAAERAVALNPALASAQSVLADLEFSWTREIDKSLARFEHAVALDPADAQSRHWYASALALSGEPSKALIEIEQAKYLSPNSRSIRVSEAIILLSAGQVAMAGERLQDLIEHEPQYRNPYRFLSFVRLAEQDYAGYLDALEKRFELTEDAAGARVVVAGRAGLASGGRAGMVAAMSALAQDETAAGELEPYFLAHLCALSEDLEKTTASLRRISTRHAFYYSIDPAFDAVRKMPGFWEALGDMKLPRTSPPVRISAR